MHDVALGSQRLAAELACTSCGAEGVQSPPTFRCPNAGEDDRDHLIRRKLNLAPGSFPTEADPNPFVRFRTLTHSYWLARNGGISDTDYVALVRGLDAELGETECIEQGVVGTRLDRNAALSEAFGFSARGGVWVKDETAGTGGSHAIRGLGAVVLYLTVAERLGLIQREDGIGAPFVISGSGHQAFAAAALARATGRVLEAYTPGAPQQMLARIRSLGARLQVSARTIGLRGDTRSSLFSDALRRGSLPFTLRPADNGVASDGEATVGWEMLADLTQAGHGLDRLIVHTGGDGLLGSLIQTFQEGGELGLVIPLPRIHALQPESCNPIFRAYDRLARRIVRRLEKAIGDARAPEDLVGRAEWIRSHAWSPIVQEELAYARDHRSAFMWYWEEPTHTLAQNLVDEEIGDWWKVCEGMLITGGFPLAVDDSLLKEGERLAREVGGYEPDLAGCAGLAGLHALAALAPPTADERIGVVLSGKTFPVEPDKPAIQSE